MKVKVLKKFKDRHTNEIHNKGEVMTITKDRYEEIMAVGEFVEEIKTPKKKTEKETE